jgi:hypothetical protein
VLRNDRRPTTDDERRPGRLLMAATATSKSSRSKPTRVPLTGHTPALTLHATFGAELVQHVTAHLTFITGCFGFVGPARVAEGLAIILSDDDALYGAVHAVFDADGDGVVSAEDLATVLSLARPFFGTSHLALTDRFANILGKAGGPYGWRVKRGIERALVPQAVYYTPALDAWMLQPVVQTAEWLMRRAAAEGAAEAWAGDANANAHARAPPPPPPKLRPPPNRRSRREELVGVEGPANPTPPMRSLTPTKTAGGGGGFSANNEPTFDDDEDTAHGVDDNPNFRGSILKRSDSNNNLNGNNRGGSGGGPVDRLRSSEGLGVRRLSLAMSEDGSEENSGGGKVASPGGGGGGGSGSATPAGALRTSMAFKSIRAASVMRASVAWADEGGSLSGSVASGNGAAGAAGAAGASGAGGAGGAATTDATAEQSGGNGSQATQVAGGGGWGVVLKTKVEKGGDTEGDASAAPGRDSSAGVQSSLSRRRPLKLKTLATAVVTVMDGKKKTAASHMVGLLYSC